MTALNRRVFLRRAAFGGCALGCSPLFAAEDRGKESLAAGAARLATKGVNAPVILISQSVSTDHDPRAKTWGYLVEVLQRAGLFFSSLAPEAVAELLRKPKAVVLLAGHLHFSVEQRELLARWVESGGCIIGIGGTSGLDHVFGVNGQVPLAEGWVRVGSKNHPVLRGLRSSLHVFGGHTFRNGSAVELADVELSNASIKGSAIVENRFGKGRTLLIGPDLMFSIVHIQQGIAVLQDGRPAPDGSAPVNEGMLKAEDGSVLDWNRDRVEGAGNGGPMFLEPITDELRELVLRSVFYLAQAEAIAVPVLWYWPRLLPAVAHMSHDSDGNDPRKAEALLEVVNRCKLKSTWCILYPGGYPREFYGRLTDQEFEVALHYDAMTGGAETSWSRQNFLRQHRWLLSTAGLDQIWSNKNHYTRWENRLDLLRWCEEAGIESDQTRGPSKKGTIGFPLGGSHPYFPLDDEGERSRFLDVLEVNLMAQDLVITCPAEYGQELTDSARRHHGVAHLLFHPAHIQKPGVAEALGQTVEYARSAGMEWWTNRQISRWERLRRGVQARFKSDNNFELRPARPLQGATLLVLQKTQQARSIAINGANREHKPWSYQGFNFDAVTLDIDGPTDVRL
ncbi:MAG TPA: hypothetical protein VN673_09845 [Clostridia bacterium]|nr:hypothetical protein [Clostridia bacterium]